jgi:GT2 family glycosyltransferase
MSGLPEVSVVVPTLGRSPWLGECLAALRRENLEIVLVDQGEEPLRLPADHPDQILRPGKNLGFAGGVNLGIRAATGDLVAVVNDDALLAPGWLAALRETLSAHPRAAAAQGVNLRLDQRVDGWGLAWNSSWQAVQLGHGQPAPGGEDEDEVFGVSATAALYRRAALEATALAPGIYFDDALESYYEDVDLACRLRAAGWTAFTVPAARARHAGSATGLTMPHARLRLLYGNRYLVVARLLGRGFWRRLPALLARDGRDALRALARGDLRTCSGIAAGWGRALRRGPAYVHRGAPAAVSFAR